MPRIKADVPLFYSLDADREGGKIYGYRVTAPDGTLVCFGVSKLFAEEQARLHSEGLVRGFSKDAESNFRWCAQNETAVSGVGTARDNDQSLVKGGGSHGE